MRNEKERELILNHPNAFNNFMIKAHNTSKNLKSRQGRSAFFEIGEGWLPIIAGVVIILESINDELIDSKEKKLIQIDGISKFDDRLSISFGCTGDVEEIYTIQIETACKLAAEISINICETCGFHHMQNNLGYKSLCRICYERSN